MLRIVEKGWSEELFEALEADSSYLRIICPFMKESVLKDLLRHRPSRIQVITRFNLSDFALAVSDVAALRRLLKSDAKVRGVQNLHTKLYLFGESRAIITSANLTEAALNRNHEFGIVTDDEVTIKQCRAYFKSLWQRAGRNLRLKDLNAWDAKVTQHQLLGGRFDSIVDLKDYGADAGISKPPSFQVPIVVTDAPQAFVKFQGDSENRMSLADSTLDELKSGGCHWAVCYSMRRRAVRDGDLMFVGRLTKEPNDIRIFGRAIGMAYKGGRDDATPDEIKQCDWKERFSHYIRVHGAEFVDGTMGNGVSLYELMDELGANSFASTQENAARGEGNTNPRIAYSQKGDVKLSTEGFIWLSERLQTAFEVHGKIPQRTLNELEWPDQSVVHSLVNDV